MSSLVGGSSTVGGLGPGLPDLPPKSGPGSTTYRLIRLGAGICLGYGPCMRRTEGELVGSETDQVRVVRYTPPLYTIHTSCRSICLARFWTTHEAYLVVFIGLQNLVEIHTVISIVWKLEYFVHLDWKCLFTPQNYAFWGFHPLNGEIYQQSLPQRHIIAWKDVIWRMYIDRQNRSTGAMHARVQKYAIETNGDESPQTASSLGARGLPSNTPIPPPTPLTIPNGIRIQSAVLSTLHFPDRHRETHRRTDGIGDRSIPIALTLTLYW